ncbi:quinol:electron acceptor oxidoreductase subunit ActD [Stieleria varia]|uniref:Histone H1-like nucleoprotein HC2 n=1 Tax=Stieleria varia TaxID=2528005 RepID=A0A5C6B060_9BACT|nr:quinol:electron acceptor oxidoreductase subunit ActD [Stieleria varia]TWU04961.1 Histone H1-like nucleoprotein HC2 [Stieleria varia]
MSEKKTETTVHGMMAEFTTVDSLLDACNRVREAGYTKTDAFTPFPVHGIDKALGIKPTILPWIALAAGLTGTAIALVMQIWMNSIDYPYIISGKPYISLPAFMPVAFELTILLASFGTFFGMWALNGLPKFSNPVFTDPRFDRATDDRFFLYIDAKDERYNSAGVRKLFDATGSQYINEVVEDDSPKKVPRFIYMVWGLSVAASVIPLLIVLKMRVTTSSQPRFHIFYDMDFSPSRDAQQTTSLFADSRAMRPDVPGTVARGQFDENLDMQFGIDMQKLLASDSERAERLVAFYTQGAEQPPAAEAPSVMETTPWLTENPVTVDAELMERGQQQFNIYCAVCHGADGKGNGLVNRRAQQIMADTWVPPASMHQDTLFSDKYPDGKLFSTISNGIRKMPGYASQIKLRDRWAIVAYVRALQKSQNGSMDLVPPNMKAEIEKKKATVDAALKAAAEKAAAEKAEAEKAAASTPEALAAKAAEEKAAAEKMAAEKAAAEKKAADEKAAAEKMAAEKAAAEKKAAEEKAAAEKAAAEKMAAEKAAAEKKAAEEKAAAEKAEAEKMAAEKAAAEKKAAEEKMAAEKAAEEKAAAEKAAAEKKAAEEKAAAEKAEAEKKAAEEKPADEKPESTEEPADGEKPAEEDAPAESGDDEAPESADGN